MDVIVEHEIKIIDKIFIQIFGFISLFIPKSNRIAFVRRSFSGSNATPVYERMKAINPNLEISIIDFGAFSQEIKFSNIINKLKAYHKLIKCKVIVTTHGPVLKSIFKTKKQIYIELWHAFPTKKAGLYLDRMGNSGFVKYTDYFLSYSEFCTLLLNSRYGLPIDKYVVLGAPRNDYLFSPHDDIYHDNFSKVIFYTPTFRESRDAEKIKSLNLWFDDFSLVRLNEFLLQNNYLFVWKLHPSDENELLKLNDTPVYSNISLLTNRKLQGMKIDFYQLLALSDLLITDYSSIYADYLLLDKPLIFTPTDLDKFSAERGVLLTPYEVWVPGPICLTQASLQAELLRCLNEPDYYEKERKFMRDLFHKYQDGHSADRVIEFILSKLDKNK